jgi:hypothetical protein
MNIYNQEEIDRIQKVKETNDKLEEFFNDKRLDWNKMIEPLFVILAADLTNSANVKKILDTQSLSLTYRQQLNDQINLFLNKRSRESAKIKRIKQDKFIFYATGFGVKTNLGEKGILIDGNLAENERCLELIESYISYLRDTIKSIDSLGYSIKNMIDLLNYLNGK